MKQRERTARRASAEPEIVRMLETLGCVVWVLQGRTHLPRLLVIRRNSRWLADVKAGARDWPTPAQEKAWTEAFEHGCEVFVLRTPDEARDMVNGALAPWEPRSATMERLRAVDEANAEPGNGGTEKDRCPRCWSTAHCACY